PPASVLLLRVHQICSGSARGFLRAGGAQCGERFQYAAGDVGAGRIENGVVIGPGQRGQRLPVVVDVEGRPAAVLRLHVYEPANPTLLGLMLPRIASGGTAP